MNTDDTPTVTTISLSMTPVLNSMFRLQWEEAQDSYVLLYPEGMVKLNGAAGEILALVDGQRSVNDIVVQLQGKFPDAVGIDSDIQQFLGEASEQLWITL